MKIASNTRIAMCSREDERVTLADYVAIYSELHKKLKMERKYVSGGPSFCGSIQKDIRHTTVTPSKQYKQ